MPHQPSPEHRTVRDAAAGIIVLGAANFVAITTEVLPVGLLPQLARGVGVDEATAGLLVTVYAFVVAALALPLTLATRRFPRKALLLTTLGVYVASNVVVALAPSFAVVAAGRTLGGIGHAVFFSVSIAYAARLVGPLHTGKALTLVTGGGTLGFVLGVPLGTSLGTAVGWRWSFGVLAVACLVTALLVARLLPAVTVPAAPRTRGRERRAGTTRLVTVAATNTAVFAGQYTVYTYVSLLLLATGMAERSVGPVLLLFGAAGVVGLWAAGRFLDVRPRALALTTLAVITASLVIVSVALPAALPVVVVGCVWLAAFGAIPATFQAAALRTGGAGGDVAGAVVNATANFGIGLGAAVGSVVVDAAGPAVLALVGAAVVAVALGLVVVARDAYPSRAARGGDHEDAGGPSGATG